MYKHMLVPIDGTLLSALQTNHAVQLAKKLGSRITFFYAAPNFGATDEGALWRDIDPKFYAAQLVGDSRAILAKAAADATSQGVPCELHAKVSDRPAEAILDTVQELGCDLIVMTTRGKRGLGSWFSGSQTERVLKGAHVPLLVTRVEENEPLTTAERALGIIHDEHRSLAVVVNGMRDLLLKAVESSHVPDMTSLQSMVQYLHDFPEKLHHPKEEQYIHARLVQRYPASRSVIEVLEEQHQAEYLAMARLDHALADCTESKADSVANLKAEIDNYANAVWKHMRLEESTLLPLANEFLTKDDWTEIAQAFEANNDPRFGELSNESFRRMFTQITHLLPDSSKGVTDMTSEGKGIS